MVLLETVLYMEVCPPLECPLPAVSLSHSRGQTNIQMYKPAIKHAYKQNDSEGNRIMTYCILIKMMSMYNSYVHSMKLSHFSRDFAGQSSSRSLSSRRFWSSADSLGKKLSPVTASMSLRGVRLYRSTRWGSR